MWGDLHTKGGSAATLYRKGETKRRREKKMSPQAEAAVLEILDNIFGFEGTFKHFQVELNH